MGGLQVRLRLERPDFTLDVDLNVPGRGVTALFGRSGCGKTSLLRCIAGLERAPGGRVTLNDEIWQNAARWLPTHRRALGYVFQEPSLFAHLSVHGNIGYGMRRVPAAQRRVALERAIALLGIGPLLDRRPARLSGGERQRVAIARALATSPRLLLMDEPLAALDAARKAELLPYLKALHAELAIPIVYVSHALDEVAQLADHLVLMEAGRVTAAGPLSETLARLDLAVAHDENAGVVLEGVVGERDARWQLARLDIPAAPCALWARDSGLPLGQRVRVRVLARDVSLACAPQTATSIGNQLRATVEEIADDTHPGLALVRVRVGDSAHGGANGAGVPLVARLTRRSAHALGLAPGLALWAQVKTVALLE